MQSAESSCLVERLQEVRQRLVYLRGRSDHISEADTKATLIEPILGALGWDVLNFEEVKREYRHKSQDNPVDYALFVHRSPILFAEAKGLRENMNDRKWITQTVNYANAIGVKWCILTNGEEYRVYNSHAECDVEEKLFRTICISDQAQHDSVIEMLELLSKDRMTEKRLDVLWKAHFIDRHVKVALQDLLKGDDPALIRLIRKFTPELSPGEIRESVKRADIQIEYAAMGLINSSGSVTESPKPVQVTLPTPQVSPTLPRRRKTKEKPDRKKSPAFVGVTVTDLIQAGLLTPPVELVRDYKGNWLNATILDDGRVRFATTSYISLSMAASEARKTIIGTTPDRPYPQTNGWSFWQIRNPTSGKLEEIDTVRQKFLKKKVADV